MTSSQFEGIIGRLKDFTTENLNQVIGKLDINLLYSKLNQMAVS